MENEGEDFEVVKRSFVSENDQAKKSLLPVLNPETQEIEEKYKILEQKVDEETDSEVDETEDPNEKPLTAADIVNLQNEMKQTWPKRLANVSSLVLLIYNMKFRRLKEQCHIPRSMPTLLFAVFSKG